MIVNHVLLARWEGVRGRAGYTSARLQWTFHAQRILLPLHVGSNSLGTWRWDRKEKRDKPAIHAWNSGTAHPEHRAMNRWVLDFASALLFLPGGSAGVPSFAEVQTLFVPCVKVSRQWCIQKPAIPHRRRRVSSRTAWRAECLALRLPHADTLHTIAAWAVDGPSIATVAASLCSLCVLFHLDARGRNPLVSARNTSLVDETPPVTSILPTDATFWVQKRALWDVQRRLVCVDMRLARMERAIAIACNVYVSEGKDRKVLQALEERAMRLGTAVCAQVFVDAAYHRTGYTFVAPWSRRERFADNVAAFSAYAVEHVDLRDHVAAHPRLGAVDHVLCAPIRPPHQDQDETWTAREVAVRVAEGLARRTDVSVALYGDADAKKRSLAEVRRALGYFKGASEGLWKGCPKWPDGAEEWLQYGPKTPPESSGVTVVGACPWVVNYNVRTRTTELQKATQVAKKVSARGGGMPGVQAMALPHEDGIEVACNLLMPDVVGPEDVQRRVEELGEEMGIPVDIGYVIGKSPQQLLEIALQNVQD